MTTLVLVGAQNEDLHDHRSITPPTRLRLRLLQAYIDSTYGKKMRDAKRAKASADFVERIHEDWMVEDVFISDEQDVRFTRKTLRLAKKLRIPYPTDADCWEETTTTTERILSPKARNNCVLLCVKSSAGARNAEATG